MFHLFNEVGCWCCKKKFSAVFFDVLFVYHLAENIEEKHEFVEYF